MKKRQALPRPAETRAGHTLRRRLFVRAEAAELRRTRQLFGLGLAGALFVALGLLAWAFSAVWLPIFAGLLVAVFLRGLSDAVGEFTGFSPGAALALVLALLVAVLAAAGWFLGAEASLQLDELIPQLEADWKSATATLRRNEWGRALLASGDLGTLSPAKADWLARLTGGIFSGTLDAVASLLVIVFIGVYVAAAPAIYRSGLLQLIPARGRQRAGEVLHALGITLHWWLVGTFAKMLLIGLATTIGLSLLGMPLALALGLIAFLCEFVPYLGPVLASIPALVFAFAGGPTMVTSVALLYLVIYTAEGYLISPLIDQRSVHLPPALAIAAQFLLGVLFGALGLVFATPLAAVALVLVRMLYVEDALGERRRLSGGHRRPFAH